MAAPFDSPLFRDFPSTSKLTREDLEELLGRRGQAQAQSPDASGDNSEAYFEAFVDSLPEVRALFEEHSKLLRDNEGKAARNLALQPQLENLRAETQQYYDRAAAAEAEWPRVEAEMKEAYRRFGPSALHAQVVQSASKLHEQSEALASAFVDGLPLESALPPAAAARSSATIDEGADAVAPVPSASTAASSTPDALFTRRYRELRTDYHRLNLIADRWAKGAVQWE
ncbi:unnamed protein product [Parajaminaea phylloscopi]